MPAAPLVSLIVPVLADRRELRRLIAETPSDSRLELVIVDGGPDEVTPYVSARADVRLIRTRPGRGHQMNSGASAARGEWLLFLHADSRLPAGWLDAVERLSGAFVGGWFRFALDDPAWQARVIERGTALRVALLRLPYGDQGVFVRRRTFAMMGGYRDLPLMEDVEFVRRLTAAGAVIELPLPLVTSARRWRRDGWFRRSFGNLALVTLYFAGVAPTRLARWYSR